MARRRAAPPTSDQVVTEEAFRILRSNLNVVLADLERPTVIITSALAGEGKTSTCANLARAFAAARQRVVVVDLDFRHPNTHLWLGGHNEFGASDVLLDKLPLADALQRLELNTDGNGAAGIYLLATGSPVHNPTELLATSRMARMLEALAGQADVMLLDTPPVLPVADTLVIGRMAAGAILVVEAARTPVTAVQRAKDALTRNQTRLLGTVINKMPSDSLGYGYGYGYGTTGTNGSSPPADDEQR